jgi:hypothetical protein
MSVCFDKAVATLSMVCVFYTLSISALPVHLLLLLMVATFLIKILVTDRRLRVSR